MKIKNQYVIDVIEICEKMGFKVKYDDNNGIYTITNLSIKIKKWNGKIEIMHSKFNEESLCNFILLYEQIKYYVEVLDKDEENDKN
jgi:DNA polymerase elongation subunit (family B)